MSGVNDGFESGEEAMCIDQSNNSAKEVSYEELSFKINTFRKLCSSNKINPNNAFDLDMTECLHKWVKKNNHEGKLDQNDFVDMSEYLDATSKIYGCRVDSVNKSINALYEKVRIGGLAKKGTNNSEDDLPDTTEKSGSKKNKRTREMITTSDKLKGSPIDAYAKLETPFNLMDLIREEKPSKYFLSKFNNTTFVDEYKKDMENSKNAVKSSNTFRMKNITKQLKEREICSEFSGFLAERDKLPRKKNTELDYIEERYDPEENQFKDCTMNFMDFEMNLDRDNDGELESNVTMKQRVKQFSELIDCIEGAKSEYSFYNPTLLANWAGPKAWKAQTMQRSLKVRNRSKYPNECLTLEEVYDGDEFKQPKVKPLKSQRKVTEKKHVVVWLTGAQINNSVLTKLTTGTQQVTPQTIEKWHTLNNAADPPAFKIKHKFTFLEYFEIEPEWLVSQNDKEKQINGENNFPEDILMIDDQNDDGANMIENDDRAIDDINDVGDNISMQSDEDDDYGGLQWMETKLDVFALKTEIKKIIKKERVKFFPHSNSFGMSFNDLLKKLNALGRELPLASVYVAILHLSNEKHLEIISNDGPEVDVAKSFIVNLQKP